MLVQAGLILQSALHPLMNKTPWTKEIHPSLMGEWSRLNNQAIRKASPEIVSSSCNDIKYLSAPQNTDMKTDFYFQHQNQTRHSSCSARTICTKPAFHWEFYKYTPLYCVHRTWTADWEETLHGSWDISTLFSVQIRLKIELCTSISLQSCSCFLGSFTAGVPLVVKWFLLHPNLNSATTPQPWWNKGQRFWMEMLKLL